MSSLNFMELCRLCLVKERVSIPIFEGEGDVRQILLKIAACLPVKVTRDDKLPKKICDGCMFKLDNAYHFWNSTANAEKQLLQWLGDVVNEDRKTVPPPPPTPTTTVTTTTTTTTTSNTIETEQLVLKEEAIEQETPDVPKNLNRVESVLDDERGGSEDEDTESDEEGSNSEDSGDEPPGKEEAESEEEAFDEPLEPTTFVNVSLACDEAGPSGIQQPAQAAATQPQQQQQQQPQAAASTSSAAAGTAAAAAASTPSGYLLQLYSGDTPTCTLFSCGICGNFLNSQQSLMLHLEAHKFAQSGSSVSIIHLVPQQSEPNKPIDSNQIASQNTINTNIVYIPTDTNRSILKKPINKIPTVSRNVSYICKVCKKDCKSEHLLKRHMALHEVKECIVCKKVFKSRTYLTRHMVVHRGEKPYPCDVCGKKFKRQYEVATHKQRIHIGIEKNFQCTICEYKAINRQHLEVHMRRHTKDYSTRCKVCGKGYYTLSELRQHENLHDKEKSFQCELCGLTFLMKGTLYHHYISVHKKERKMRKIHTCEHCGLSIQKKKEFYKHVRTHTGEKETYLCDICGKGVASRDSLQKHKRSHTGEKPYECGDCGKCFSRRQSLQMHVRTHTGERPFSCKECGKSFTQQSTLIVHKRYHTGQRPYKCQVCKKGFVTLTLLKTHQKTSCA